MADNNKQVNMLLPTEITDRMEKVKEKLGIPFTEQAEKALYTYLAEMEDIIKKMKK